MSVHKPDVAQTRVETRPKLQSYHFRISPEIYERLQWKAVEFGVPLSEYVRGLFKRATAGAQRPNVTENLAVSIPDPLAPFAELPALFNNPQWSVVELLHEVLKAKKAAVAT
jgi:hypothetical protein